MKKLFAASAGLLMFAFGTVIPAGAFQLSHIFSYTEGQAILSGVGNIDSSGCHAQSATGLGTGNFPPWDYMTNLSGAYSQNGACTFWGNFEWENRYTGQLAFHYPRINVSSTGYVTYQNQ